MGSTKGRIARETSFRWAVLVMLMISIYSFVYCYDNPNALQNELIREYGITQVQYNMLYSIYGWVNMIAPLVAGMLIDCLGIYASTLGFQVMIVIGQTLWILGTMTSSYGLMLFGRAVFGVGAEQYHTSRKWFAYEYFTGAEYMLASGLTLSASRFASASQSNATYKVYTNNGGGQKGIFASLSIGWALVVFSLILSIFFTIYQKHYYAKLEKRYSDSLSQAADEKEKQQMTRPSPAIASDDEEDDWDKHQAQDWDKFQLKALCQCKFDGRFWLFGSTLVCFYSTYLAYSNVGSAFIQSRYQKSHEQGNTLAPITFWIAAIFTPIQGFICDYYGKRMPFMMLSAFCLLLGHIFVGFIGNADKSDGILIFGLVLLGLGYSIGAGACWPCCGIIVKQKYLATALGWWACVDNGFQATMFVIVGALTKDYAEEEYDKPSPNPARIHEFDDARWLWIALALCTMICVLLLWYFDGKKENILMKPEEKYMIKRGLVPTNPKDAVDIVENDDEHDKVVVIKNTTEQANVVEVEIEETNQ